MTSLIYDSGDYSTLELLLNRGVIDLGMARLGQRTSTVVRSQLLTEIKKTIQRLERGPFLPWFLERTIQLNVTENDTYVSLGNFFLREAEESRPYYVLDGTVYYLTKRYYGALLGETPTSIKYYAIRGTEFHFRMAADQSYTINVPAYFKDPWQTEITDTYVTTESLWLLNALDWVLEDALSKVAALHLHDMEKAQLHMAAAAMAKKELYVYHESRVHENQDFEVGGATDGS